MFKNPIQRAEHAVLRLLRGRAGEPEEGRDGDQPLLERGARLVEGRFGKGRVLPLHQARGLSPGTTSRSDWAFLPWVHQALDYLSSQESKGEGYRLREEVKFQALAAHYKDRITVTNPAGQTTVLNPSSRAPSRKPPTEARTSPASTR